MKRPTLLRVAHLVDAMGGSEHLWGKEQVVTFLMRGQRASGLVDPTLVRFSPGFLADLTACDRFQVASMQLYDENRRVS